MSKYTASLLLWFYAAWTFGGFIGYVTGASELIGPIMGLAGVAIVARTRPRTPRRSGWSAA